MQELAIFEKTYELILWLYPTVNKFPKSQRFVLGQRVENAMLEILEKIIAANQSRSKLVYLKKISVELDTLRILMRLSKDLHFINIRQYEFAAVKINEIGKMLGGWMKFCADAEAAARREI
jgi:four helix bundle protein